MLPHSIFFGYLIEWAEAIVGLGLLAGAIMLLGHLPQRGERQFNLARGLTVFGMLAGLTCAFLCANFHFFMGDGMLPALDPTHPYNEGVDLDTLMPPLALIVAAANAPAVAGQPAGRTAGAARIAGPAAPVAPRQRGVTLDTPGRSSGRRCRASHGSPLQIGRRHGTAGRAPTAWRCADL